MRQRPDPWFLKIARHTEAMLAILAIRAKKYCCNIATMSRQYVTAHTPALLLPTSGVLRRKYEAYSNGLLVAMPKNDYNLCAEPLSL